MNKIETTLPIETKDKLIYIEIIRIIAAFLVIFNHTGSKGYFLFASYPFGTLPYFSYMIFTVICKIAVPLYLMVTGALLLKKDIPLKKIYKDKVLRILLVLLLFSSFYYIRLYVIKYSDILNLPDFLLRVYKGDIIVPFWYLYAYISFLIAFPFLRAMVKSMPEYGYKYLIILSIIFVSIIPPLEYFLSSGEVSLNQYGKIGWLFTNIVIYPLVGYYLENKIEFEKINKKHLIILTLFTILGIFISCYMTYFKHNITGTCTEETSQDFLTVFVLPISISLYIKIKYLCKKVQFSNILKKIILSVGSCSFGIYLTHFAIIESNFINSLWKNLTKVNKCNYMMSILLLCILTMFLSYIITFILKKIPGIKKIL